MVKVNKVLMNHIVEPFKMNIINQSRFASGQTYGSTGTGNEIFVNIVYKNEIGSGKGSPRILDTMHTITERRIGFTTILGFLLR